MSEIHQLNEHQRKCLEDAKLQNTVGAENISELKYLKTQQDMSHKQLMEENRRLQNAVFKLENEVRMKVTEISKKQISLDGIQKDLQAIEREKKQLSSEVERLKRENTHLSFRLEELAVREKYIKDRKVKLTNDAKHIESQDPVVRELQSKISEREEQIEDLLNQLNQQEILRKKDFEKIEALSDENDRLRKEVRDLKAELDTNAGTAFQSQDVNIEDLRLSFKEEAVKQQKRIKMLEQQVTSLTLSLNEAQEDLERQKSSFQDRERNPRYIPTSNSDSLNEQTGLDYIPESQVTP